MKTNLFFSVVGIFTAFIVMQTPISAQDDSYGHVQFVNTTDKTVEIKYWNPRDEGVPYVWKVEAGKSLDFSDKSGAKLRVGIYSSQIVVNGGAAKAIVRVSAKNADNSKTVITWTDKGYKDEDKPAL